MYWSWWSFDPQLRVAGVLWLLLRWSLKERSLTRRFWWRKVYLSKLWHHIGFCTRPCRNLLYAAPGWNQLVGRKSRDPDFAYMQQGLQRMNLETTYPVNGGIFGVCTCNAFVWLWQQESYNTNIIRQFLPSTYSLSLTFIQWCLCTCLHHCNVSPVKTVPQTCNQQQCPINIHPICMLLVHHPFLSTPLSLSSFILSANMESSFALKRSSMDSICTTIRMMVIDTFISTSSHYSWLLHISPPT